MEENYLAVLLKYKHLPSYLNTILEKLVREGLASDGVDGNREHLITILYDDNNNPYLLFNVKYLEIVKEELKKRAIKADGAFKVDNIGDLEDSLDGKVHSEIQEDYLHGPISMQ